MKAITGTGYVPGVGPVPSRWVLLGERPGRMEAHTGRPFMGEAGEELWGALDRHSRGTISRRDFYITNVRKDYAKDNKTPTEAEIGEALPALLDELEGVRPEVIVALGATACTALGFTRPLADIHGIAHRMEVAGRLVTVYPCLHPAALLHNASLAASFHWDIARLCQYVLPGKPSPSTETPVVWTPYTGGYTCMPNTTAVDTEGWPDLPWGLSLCGAAVLADSPSHVPAGAITMGDLRARGIRQLALINKILQEDTLVMHNGAGDVNVLRAMGLHVDKPWQDTMVMAFHDIVRTGSGALTMESQGLKTLAYRELGMTLSHLEDIEGVDLKRRVLPTGASMREYATNDAIATYELYAVYKARGLADDPLVQRDMAALPYVAAMEAAGVPVDRQDVAALHDRLLRRESLLDARLSRMAKRRLGKSGFNPRSAPQVRELLKASGVIMRGRTKGGQPSTSEKALAMAAEAPVVRLIQAAREVSKMKGTYVEPLLYEITEEGRLHPSFASTRILTGRLATKGFPLLGVPKHSREGKRIRAAIKAPPGSVIYRADLSQVELRIAAHMSQDLRLMAAYHQGKDIHAYVAHRVFGAPEAKEAQDESKHRLPSKALNFGYWMGISIKGLTEQIRKAGNRDWAKGCMGCEQHGWLHDVACDSAILMREFEKAFPGAREYQKGRIEHLQKTGYAYGLWGEQWYLPSIWSEREDIREGAERQSFALPIQSGNARLLKGAMATLSTAGFPDGVEPIAQIHDELVFVVREDLLHEWHGIVVKAMEGAASLSVPIKAEGSYGPDWAHQTALPAPGA